MEFERVKSGEYAGQFVRLPVVKLNQKIVNAPRSGRTVSGYGKNLATNYMVRTVDNKWRRVYAVCYSNASTLYVRIGGSRVIVDLL